MADRVRVYFFLDGQEIAVRFWLIIPRVGDEVMLREPPEPYVVKRVVFAAPSLDPKNKTQRINIEIEPVHD
ncbi:hypothetical protein [Rhodoligotrophos defluvii]|uniref:hypothetical protein n=1 Tax=Rhodoligotrophos defluvii TaxID=2561934 RepID=UPI0010C9534C|nr:hypothetical protein [Rhodoligotrophos defluvii]